MLNSRCTVMINYSYKKAARMHSGRLFYNYATVFRCL